MSKNIRYWSEAEIKRYRAWRRRASRQLKSPNAWGRIVPNMNGIDGRGLPNEC